MLTFSLRVARVILPVAIVVSLLVVGWFLISGGQTIKLGSMEIRAAMLPEEDEMGRLEQFVRFIPHLIGAYGLFQLWRLFGAFLTGRTFSQEAVDHLGRFGIALIVSIVAAIVINGFLGGPTGERGLIVNQYQLFLILIGFVFLLIARAFARARGNAEELERYF